MTIAEKFYRKWYRLKDDVKLTNEQWKVVNMLHHCLKANNKPKLPHGTILVERKQLVEHLNAVKMCLAATDKVMLAPENKAFANSPGGKNMGKIWTALNNTKASVLNFILDVPLERACNDLDEEISEK